VRGAKVAAARGCGRSSDSSGRVRLCREQSRPRAARRATMPGILTLARQVNHLNDMIAHVITYLSDDVCIYWDKTSSSV